MNKIDLRTVREILDQAVEEAGLLHGTEYDDDGTASSSKREVASRLLYLSDSLQLASSLVRGEYWEGRR